MTQVERIYDPNIISFPKLGWEFSIDPTAFTLFGIEVQWYGILISLGLLLAMVYCFPRMKTFGIDSDRAIDAVIGGVVGGIIGARLYYVLLRWDEYAWDWKAIVNMRNGGLAIYGGLIGAVAVGMIICKIRKVRILPMLDIAVQGFLIGQGIGRWGNFVNQEAFGSNTDSLFGMTGGTIQNTIIQESAFMDGSMVAQGISESYAVHPCFLYESVWCLLGFVILALFTKKRKYDGQLFLVYLAWYGAERFVVEGLRTDSLMLGNMRASQVLSALLAVTALILLFVMHFKVKRDPESFVLYVNTDESRALLAEAEERKTASAKDRKESSEEAEESLNTILAQDDNDNKNDDEDTADEASQTAEDDNIKQEEN